MQIGDALGGGWDLYKRFWRHFIPIALVVYVAIALVVLVLTLLFGWVGAVLGGLISIAGVFFLQAALVEAVSDVRDGKADLSIGETLGRVWPRAGTVIVAGILAAIAIGIGFLLLIAPGLYLLTIWSMIIPAIVLEHRGIGESFGRSRELVRGYGWTVFGVILVTFLLVAVSNLVLDLALTPLDDSLANFISDVVSGTVFVPFVAATYTVMYFLLRDLKEPAAAPEQVEGAAFTE
jgi:hypothetical protein